MSEDVGTCYEDDLEIDPDSLDVEWLDHSRRVRVYGDLLAKARRSAKFADERVKTIRSELILEANRDGIPGIDRLSDPKVEAYYRTQKKYLDAKEEKIEAEYEQDLLEVAYNTFNFHRKKALELLVELHGQQYFAGPSVPRNLTREWEAKVKEKKAEKNMEKQAEKLRQKRRRKDG